MNWLIKVSALGIVLMCSGCAMKLGKLWTPDCVVEEVVEEIIELKTGLDVDLSPRTPEGD